MSIPIPPNNASERKNSMAKLSSSFVNTPSSVPKNIPPYNYTGNTPLNTSGNLATNVLIKDKRTSISSQDQYGSTPTSRKIFPPFRSASPVIESDDELINGSPTSYGSFIDDPTIIKSVNKHLPTDPSSALKLPSGDITRDLYQLNNPKPSIRRSKSISGITGDDSRRGSMVSQMRLPGGFRRDFLITKKERFGYTLSKPTIITKNFLEFLTIYGHFAGEDLEDEDFLACDYDTSNDKSDEESPLLRQNVQSSSSEQKTSSIKAFFLLIKAFIGTGVLFLPKAFSNGGLLFCILLLLLFSILSYYCYLVLSQSTIKTGITSFAEMGNSLYGKHLKYLILISIVLSQIGFVAAYTVFTAENLKAFVHNTTEFDLPLHYFVIFETIFFVPMSLVRNITKLSLAALVANVFILVGIATIVYYTSMDLIKNGPSPVTNFNSDNWSLFIGVAIFAYEGIGLIIPVQQSMKNPKDFPKVLLGVITVCSFLFIGMGTLCYKTYGDNVQTVVILNLPQDSVPVILIQLFYSVAIMLSVPLQLLPAIRLMESRIFKRTESGKKDQKIKWMKNFFRLLVTLFTSTVAYFGSANLDLFVSIIGCFACIPLVYMYPPMIHMKAIGQESRVLRYLDMFLVIFGGCAIIFTALQLMR